MWKRAVGEKRAVKIRKMRSLFVKRFGHLPEDRRGGVMVIQPSEELDPVTGEMVERPGALIPTTPQSNPGWSRGGSECDYASYSPVSGSFPTFLTHPVTA
jgi:hypothetical protein